LAASIRPSARCRAEERLEVAATVKSAPPVGGASSVTIRRVL
jgi:hypothetical protein